ncbi:MAG: hypothetical protein QM752_06460 [Gammaproteobacteria bacterium]
MPTFFGLNFLTHYSSSARKLKRAGVNLLAGRAIVRHLHPFLAGELAETFSLSAALQYGLVR